MRIAQIAPVATTIPPPKSGSVELMTSLLTEGLIERGHDVTLFATGDSVTKAKLRATFPRGYWHDEEMYPWEFYEMVNLSAACERAADFDIIHYQAAYYPMSLAFTRLVETPFVQTVHLQPDESQLKLWKHYAEANFVAISDCQSEAMSGLNVVGTVYHGIETDAFTFRAAPDDYLLFFGRFTPEKGVLEAIEVAKRLGIKLLMAAPDDPYYHESIEAHVDGKFIQYVGEVDHAGRNRLLGGALALVYPVQAAEPFGLVLVEAMACGTPVLALDKGAVSEIIVNGVNGFRVQTLHEMTEIFPQVLKLDRAAIRAFAVERFDARRMVDDYIKIYERICQNRLPRREDLTR
ncbi:MAG TPA: glycosyltransferase family 4 protein [Pyrinomonadaceae bacterium]|nr:glycosyltransferase family 4 protein [Pyrinomonadaceae bacterium]